MSSYFVSCYDLCSLFVECLGNLSNILMFFDELYIPYDVVFAIHMSSLTCIGRKKEPSL